MQKFIAALSQSSLAKILMTLLVYSFYALIIGLAAFPAVTAIVLGVRGLLVPLDGDLLANVRALLVFSLVVGGAVYLYFIFGAIVYGFFYRLLSLGVKEGVYPINHPTFLRWLIYSGIFTIAEKSILPYIVMTPICLLYFRISGAKIGKNVYINTPHLNDPYLMEFGDNIVIGGQTDMTCHTFENNRLFLGRIKIGSNTLVGSHCYITPNTVIGNHCTIGISTSLRKNTNIPDNTRLGSLSGLSPKQIIRFEKNLFANPKREVLD